MPVNSRTFPRWVAAAIATVTGLAASCVSLTLVVISAMVVFAPNPLGGPGDDRGSWIALLALYLVLWALAIAGTPMIGVAGATATYRMFRPAAVGTRSALDLPVLIGSGFACATLGVFFGAVMMPNSGVGALILGAIAVALGIRPVNSRIRSRRQTGAKAFESLDIGRIAAQARHVQYRQALDFNTLIAALASLESLHGRGLVDQAAYEEYRTLLRTGISRFEQAGDA